MPRRTLDALHLDAIATAAATQRAMICCRADGSEIEHRKVASYARLSMQASADHRTADAARADLGAVLDHVRFIGRGGVTLHFRPDGRSFFKGL